MDDTGVRFGLLWGDAHLAVRSYIHALIGDPATTDDVVQEVALAACSSFASYDATRSFTGWAIGIARHVVHQHWEKRYRHRVVVQDAALLDDLAAIAADIDEEALAEREALRACLDSLQGRAWEIMRRFYVEGQATQVIAESLQLAVGNVRVLMHRTRAALRTCIERRLQGRPSHG